MGPKHLLRLDADETGPSYGVPRGSPRASVRLCKQLHRLRMPTTPEHPQWFPIRALIEVSRIPT